MRDFSAYSSLRIEWSYIFLLTSGFHKHSLQCRVYIQAFQHVNRLEFVWKFRHIAEPSVTITQYIVDGEWTAIELMRSDFHQHTWNSAIKRKRMILNGVRLMPIWLERCADEIDMRRMPFIAAFGMGLKLMGLLGLNVREPKERKTPCAVEGWTGGRSTDNEHTRREKWGKLPRMHRPF